jgi:hypothetical protein
MASQSAASPLRKIKTPSAMIKVGVFSVSDKEEADFI